MKLNLKHISEDFFNEEEFKKQDKMTDWLNSAQISINSKFSDNIWKFSGCELYGKTFNIIEWEKETPKGNLLKNYPSMLFNLKKVVYFLSTTIVTRKKYKVLTQVQTYFYFIFLIDWLIDNSIYKFSQINKEIFNKYINFLKVEKNNRALSDYTRVFNYLYLYKDYLEDSIKEDFFEGISVSAYFEYSGKEKEQTQRIPNEILEKIILKITPIIDYFYYENIKFEEILNQNILVKPRLAKYKLQSMTNNKKKEYNTIIINTIAYFTIGLYAGMRISEILSMKKNMFSIDENNVVLLNSTLFKFAKNEGRPEKWGCGLNNENNYALKCIKILQNLSPNDNLFFMYKNDKFYDLRLKSLNNYLNDLMEFCEVDWKISSHQLRRTFATLIGIVDKTCLVALKEHFKHVSINMTNYYVGNNLELLSIISEEKQIEINEGLQSILSSDKLAGKLGEKIAQNNLSFRGNIELRQDYINEILNNSDLIVVPHEYGFCIYQPEQARCKGESKNIGLNTCTKCNNFAVSEKHKIFWLNRVEQYENFKEDIISISSQGNTIEELNFEIVEAQKIIKKII